MNVDYDSLAFDNNLYHSLLLQWKFRTCFNWFTVLYVNDLKQQSTSIVHKSYKNRTPRQFVKRLSNVKTRDKIYVSILYKNLVVQTSSKSVSLHSELRNVICDFKHIHKSRLISTCYAFFCMKNSKFISISSAYSIERTEVLLQTFGSTFSWHILSNLAPQYIKQLQRKKITNILYLKFLLNKHLNAGLDIFQN